MSLLTLYLVFFFSFKFVTGRKSRVSKLRSPLEELDRKKVGQTIIQRGLLSGNSTDVAAKDIVLNHNQVFQFKSMSNFPGPITGFVTPWNKEGMKFARRYRNKLDLIVPVWYDIRFEGGDKVNVNRNEKIDKKWLESLKKPDKTGLAQKKAPKIAPRFYFDNWNRQNFELLITNDKLVQSLVSKVKRECEDNGFDGVFLDFGSLAFQSIPGLPEGHPDFQKFQQEISMILFKSIQFFEVAGKEFKKAQLEFHIAVASASLFTQSFPLIHQIAVQRALTANWLTSVMVMAYDYGGHGSGGPNGPLQWAVGSCESLLQAPPGLPPNFGEVRPAQASQIRLGINFFGTDNVGGKFERDLTGKDYLKILKEYKTTFSWNSQAHEHQLEYFDVDANQLHTVYYPTLLSIYLRIQVARERGFGLAIWELGQGLEYFFDLL